MQSQGTKSLTLRVPSLRINSFASQGKTDVRCFFSTWVSRLERLNKTYLKVERNRIIRMHSVLVVYPIALPREMFIDEIVFVQEIRQVSLDTYPLLSIRYQSMVESSYKPTLNENDGFQTFPIFNTEDSTVHFPR